MKRKKIYYFPGLVSIIGLPILLFFFRPEDRVQLTSIKLSLPSDRENGGPSWKIFSKANFYKSLRNKKIIAIDLNDIRDDDKSEFYFSGKLNFISREIENMQFTNDTSTIVKIDLGDANYYCDFIWLLNQALIYRFGRYGLVDNSFYFLPNRPVVHEMPNYEYTKLMADSLFRQNLSLFNDSSPFQASREPTKWEIFTRQLKEQLTESYQNLRQSYLFVIGFIVLIGIPGIIRIRNLAMSNL
jgi:hypothetical protein